MLVEVKVPALSESVSEASLVSWHKKEGEFVQRDENLIDVETDKVVLELPAPESGVLASIKKGDGEAVKAQEVIAVIDTAAKAVAGGEAPPPGPGKAASPAASPGAGAAAGDGSTPPGVATAMPAARKLMADRNIDPAEVLGTGRGGRITKADVLATVAAEAPAATAAPSPPAALPPAGAPEPAKPASTAPPAGPAKLAGTVPASPVPAALGERLEQRVPMSRLRQRVAERLVESQSTAAILTTFNEVDMQPVIDLRSRYRERFEKEHGVKLGFMSFFVAAAVHALKRYPIVNASIDGSDIVYHGYYDIGIAVSSPRGLVVPILRDADQLSIADIEKQVADFGKRAQEGKLAIEDLTGGTFSISNGGVFGSMLSTPIINPPQSAILGVHATKERPVVVQGQIVVRPVNYLALSYDHRIIDGREAVLSLVAIKEALEDPARMLLDL